MNKKHTLNDVNTQLFQGFHLNLRWQLVEILSNKHRLTFYIMRHCSKMWARLDEDARASKWIHLFLKMNQLDVRVT